MKEERLFLVPRWVSILVVVVLSIGLVVLIFTSFSLTSSDLVLRFFTCVGVAIPLTLYSIDLVKANRIRARERARQATTDQREREHSVEEEPPHIRPTAKEHGAGPSKRRRVTKLSRLGVILLLMVVTFAWVAMTWMDFVPMPLRIGIGVVGIIAQIVLTIDLVLAIRNGD